MHSQPFILVAKRPHDASIVPQQSLSGLLSKMFAKLFLVAAKRAATLSRKILPQKSLELVEKTASNVHFRRRVVARNILYLCGNIEFAAPFSLRRVQLYTTIKCHDFQILYNKLCSKKNGFFPICI